MLGVILLTLGIIMRWTTGFAFGAIQLTSPSLNVGAANKTQTQVILSYLTLGPDMRMMRDEDMPHDCTGNVNFHHSDVGMLE